MRVCVHTMWCGCVVYLYTGVELSSWKGRVECEMWATYWNKQQDTEWARTDKEDTYGRRLARGSVHLWIEAMQDVFARCFKQMAVQVCTKLWLYSIIIPVEVVVKNYCSILPVYNYNCPCTYTWFAVLIDVYFSQVKNKPWLRWVYSWIQHRCEQLPPFPMAATTPPETLPDSWTSYDPGVQIQQSLENGPTNFRTEKCQSNFGFSILYQISSNRKGPLF